MTELMTYATAFRRSEASSSTPHPHIMTRGKQFEIQPSDGVQYCIAPGRRTGNPPKRAAAGGGKYAKQRASAYAHRGSGGMEHAQVAFTNPDWRNYGSGAAAVQPMSRGAITNIGTDHQPREIPKYATPVRNVTFDPLRGGCSNSIASPAFELRAYSSAPSSSSSFAPFSSGPDGTSSRYARPFCAERFTDSSSSSSSSSPSALYYSANGKAGAGRYSTVGREPNEEEEGEEQEETEHQDTAPHVGHQPGVVNVSAPETSVVGQEPFRSEGREREDEELPMYWYGAAPAASSSLNTAPWDRHAPARLLSDWTTPSSAAARYGNNNDNDNNDEGFQGHHASLRFLTDRVNRLAQQLEKNQMDRIDSATEEWLASAVLGLFVICVVDALRNK